MIYYTVTYFREGKEQGYAIVSAKTAGSALRRAKQLFLRHKPGNTFKVSVG